VPVHEVEKMVENAGKSLKNLVIIQKITYFALCFVAHPVKRLKMMRLAVI